MVAASFLVLTCITFRNDFLCVCTCGNSGVSASVPWFYRRRWRSVRGERRGTRYVYDLDTSTLHSGLEVCERCVSYPKRSAFGY